MNGYNFLDEKKFNKYMAVSQPNTSCGESQDYRLTNKVLGYEGFQVQLWFCSGKISKSHRYRATLPDHDGIATYGYSTSACLRRMYSEVDRIKKEGVVSDKTKARKRLMKVLPVRYAVAFSWNYDKKGNIITPCRYQKEKYVGSSYCKNQCVFCYRHKEIKYERSVKCYKYTLEYLGYDSEYIERASGTIKDKGIKSAMPMALHICHSCNHSIMYLQKTIDYRGYLEYWCSNCNSGGAGASFDGRIDSLKKEYWLHDRGLYSDYMHFKENDAFTYEIHNLNDNVWKFNSKSRMAIDISPRNNSDPWTGTNSLWGIKYEHDTKEGLINGFRRAMLYFVNKYHKTPINKHMYCDWELEVLLKQYKKLESRLMYFLKTDFVISDLRWWDRTDIANGDNGEADGLSDLSDNFADQFLRPAFVKRGKVENDK